MLDEARSAKSTTPNDEGASAGKAPTPTPRPGVGIRIRSRAKPGAGSAIPLAARATDERGVLDEARSAKSTTPNEEGASACGSSEAAARSSPARTQAPAAASDETRSLNTNAPAAEPRARSCSVTPRGFEPLFHP